MRDLMYRFAQFMQGRYGSDPFNRFLGILAIIFFIISLFFMRVPGVRFFYWISIALVVYQFFRMFSRNIEARRKELDLYFKVTDKIRGFFGVQKRRWNERSEYAYFKCPQCKVQVRVPRGRGKIEITCPRCRTSFIKRT